MGQKLLTMIRLIRICYFVPWWLSLLSDQIAFSNPESDTIFGIGTERFGNSESPCHPDASYQVSAQSDLPFGRCSLNNFKILDIGTERF